MLLCGLQDVRPGAVVAAPIARPGAPDVELLKPGVPLDAGLLNRLATMGVHDVWIEDDAVRDLDPAIIAKLSGAKLAVFQQFKQNLGTISNQTVSAGHIQSYRQSLASLACMLIGDGKHASLTDSLFESGGMAAHATNVAYLSILVGLELVPYIIKERPKLGAAHAKDMGALGLAGMLHDIGKAGCEREAANHHEAHGAPAAGPPVGYDQHTLEGYKMLRAARTSASVTQAALNHHQRFDGTGWPDMAAATSNRRSGTQSGHQIHIFTRIVSAANTLDNLLRTGEGERLPPVAALHAFSSTRFNGWFDPIVRRTLIRRVPPFAVGGKIELSDGRSAVVVTPSLAEPCRPTVRVLAPETRGAPANGCVVDLRDAPELSIARYLGIDVSKWIYKVGPGSADDAPAEPAPTAPAPSAARDAKRDAA